MTRLIAALDEAARLDYEEGLARLREQLVEARAVGHDWLVEFHEGRIERWCARRRADQAVQLSGDAS